MVSEEIDKYIIENKDQKNLLNDIENISNKFNVSTNFIKYRMFNMNMDCLDLSYNKIEANAIRYLLKKVSTLEIEYIGLYTIKISEKFGVHRDVLLNYLHANCLMIEDDKNKKKALIVRYIIENKIRYLNGQIMVKDIANKFNMTDGRINTILRYTIPEIHRIICDRSDTGRARIYFTRHTDLLTLYEISDILSIAPGVIAKFVCMPSKPGRLPRKIELNQINCKRRDTKRELVEKYILNNNINLSSITDDIKNDICKNTNTSKSYVNNIISDMFKINNIPYNITIPKKVLIKDHIIANNLLDNIDIDTEKRIALLFNTSQAYVSNIIISMRKSNKYKGIWRRRKLNGTK